MSQGKYIVSLITCLLVPYIVGFVCLLLALPQYYFTLYPCMLLLFVVLGLAFYPVLKTNSDNRHKFFSRFIANTLFKLFVSLIILLLYVALIKEQAISFVIVYFVFYVILSVFEIKLFSRMRKIEDNVRQ
jgi:hypothetical protein